MKDKWLDDIREKISDYEMKTPDGLWDSIREGMKTVVESPHEKKNRFPYYICATAAASVVLLIGLSVFFYFSNNHTDYNIVNLQANLVKNTQDETAERPETTSTQTSHNIIAQGVQLRRKNIERPISASKDYNIESMASSSEPETQVKPETSLAQCNELSSEINSSDEDERHFEDILSLPEPKTAKNTDNRLALGVSTSASGIAGTVSGERMSGNLFGSDPFMDANNSNDPETRMGTLKMDGLELPTIPGHAVFEHKLPARVGIDVAWRFDRKFALQTGLTYTLLKSDITYGGAASYGKATQMLHYIGVPLSIRYIPFTLKNFDVYISGGVLFEKCISGKISNESPMYGAFTYDGCNDRPFQFSVNTAAGLQYNISNFCGIYVEPGIGWYADDGSMLRTIYKERPWNFDLNVGIRFSF